MLKWFIFSFALLSAINVGLAQENCKIMAECGGNLQWKDWFQGIDTGRPGKRGSPGLVGLQGPKGDAGETIIVKQEDDGSVPEMHYLGHTTTWNAAKMYCRATGKTMCRSDELCIHKDGGRHMIHEVIIGDHWVPVIDGHNKWMQAGDSRRFTCFTYTETHSRGMASWGNSINPQPHKGFVYCCGKRFAGMRYQYIGQAATYASSKQHCVNQGRRLCHAGEICSNNQPVNGVIARDTWVAVKDRDNEWIQIGNTRTCSIHSVIFSNKPAWGVRTDGKLWDFLGFVLCCPL